MSAASPDVGPLRAVLAELPPPDASITTGEPLLREEAPNHYVMMGLRYLPVIDRLWAAFRAAGFPVDGQYDYGPWCDAYLEQAGTEWFEPRQVETMTRAECFTLLRMIERQERFGEGMWQVVHERGLFHALAERMIALDMRQGAMLRGRRTRRSFAAS